MVVMGENPNLQGFNAPERTRTSTRKKPDKALNLVRKVFAVSDASICGVFVRRSRRFGRSRTFWMLSKCCHGASVNGATSVVGPIRAGRLLGRHAAVLSPKVARCRLHA